MTSQAEIATRRDRHRGRCCWCFSHRVLRVDTSARQVKVVQSVSQSQSFSHPVRIVSSQYSDHSLPVTSKGRLCHVSFKVQSQSNHSLPVTSKGRPRTWLPDWAWCLVAGRRILIGGLYPTTIVMGSFYKPIQHLTRISVPKPKSVIPNRRIPRCRISNPKSELWPRVAYGPPS